MKVSVQDARALLAIRPLNVAAYLRARDWKHESEIDERASLWTWKGPDGQEADLVLPLRSDVSDFALRMSEVLRTLSTVERRSQLEILQDLLTSTADLIRIRAVGTTSIDGALPLEQAVRFVEASRNMVLAAACAAIEKRAFYAKRKADAAMEYIGRVRMGQTERGSYVLTILSPVPPELAPNSQLLPLGLPEEEPYERRVMRTLMDALTSLRNASGEFLVTENGAPFLAAVNDGVSANLCDAVSDVLEVAGENLEVGVTWSKSRSTQRDRRVTIAANSAPVIALAARMFRAVATVEDFEVQGLVIHLHRGPSARSGDVTITANVENRWRNVVVELPDPDYSLAVQAHDQRRAVSCIGDLVREGRGFRLLKPRHFAVIDDAQGLV
jgi:hypothetical protein